VKIKILVVVGLLFVALIAGTAWNTSVVEAGNRAGIRERATGSNFGIMFWSWGLPHYGVSFRGSNGADPNYTGAGGNAATNPFDGGIKNWNWWGNELGTLLTPKSWLCYPAFNCGSDRTTPTKYNAIVTR
jgi:hypothetical protein